MMSRLRSIVNFNRTAVLALGLYLACAADAPAQPQRRPQPPNPPRKTNPPRPRTQPAVVAPTTNVYVAPGGVAVVNTTPYLPSPAAPGTSGVPFPALNGMGPPSTGGIQGYLIRYYGQAFAPWAPNLGGYGYGYALPAPGFAGPGLPTLGYGYAGYPTTSGWNPFSGGYNPFGWFGY
jgi:hypothetical protein